MPQVVQAIFRLLSAIAIGIASASALAGIADEDSIRFDRITTSDGLSQGGVFAITQDRFGYIWIGTQEGLNRFDGELFRHYFHTGEPGAISHDTIWSLEVTSDGELLIGTEGGLNSYDPLTDSFSVLDIGFDTSSELVVYAVVEDSDRNLWVGSSEGLSRVEPNGDVRTFQHDVANNQSIGKGSVRSLHVSAKGELWIGTQFGGLSRMDLDGSNVQRFEYEPLNPNSISGNYVRSISEDVYGKIWVATFNSGLSIFDPYSGQWDRRLAETGMPNTIGANRLRSVFRDRSDRMWVGTETGLSVWRPASNDFVTHSVDLTDPRSLAHNMVLTLFQDRGGVIWVGTFNGLSKWNADVMAFPGYKIRSEEGSIVSSSSVSSFAETKSGDVWIGTFGGLNKWSNESKQLEAVGAEAVGLSDIRVMSLTTYGDQIWAGTMAGGVNVIEDGYVLDVYRHLPDDPTSISGNGISSYMTDSSGQLWITVYGGGLNRYEGEGKFSRFPSGSNPFGSFPDLRCMDVVEASDGLLWVATDGGGVVILNPHTGDTAVLSHDPENPNSISSDNIVTLLSTKDAIWIGSRDKGLNKYSDGKVTRYAKAEGLASDLVYGLLEDSLGRIWISGGKGLSVLDPETNEFENYTTIHGLQSDDFNSGAYYKMEDGSMLFGGNEGFNAFNPLSSRQNEYKPEILITEFSKFNRPFQLKSLLSEITEIELGYEDAVIGFHFAAFDYTAPKKNQYRYMLEGFDTEWVDAEDSRQVTYTNLDAGSYTFRVIGSNNDGVWNEEGASVDLLVMPPPWATWWAYSIYGFLAVFLLWQVLQLNAARQRRVSEKQYSARLQLYIDSLEEATDCVLIADRGGKLIYANASTRSLLGHEPQDVLGKPLFKVLFSREEDVVGVRDVLSKEGRFHGEISADTPGGRTTEVTIAQVGETAPLPDLENLAEEPAYVAISRDVTQRKRTEAELDNHRRNLEFLVTERTRALEKEIAENKANQLELAESLREKELLLKEVHHRVKNNMQVISSLLNLQAETAGSELFSNLLGESQQRIKSMSLIHENLYQSDNFLEINFEDYINMLTNSLARFYANTGAHVRLNVNVEEVVLDLDKAVPCGLIINELVSNALKHAFRGRTGAGNIDITFKREDCGYVLTIADDGVGLPEGFSLTNTSSMGMEIVSILTEQLDGKLRVGPGPGASFEIAIPGKEFNEQQA